MRGFRHPYMWGRNHPLVVDILIAGSLLAFAILTGLASPSNPNERATDALAIALTTIAIPPLVLRRRHPVAIMFVIWPATILFASRSYVGGGPIFATLFGLYAVAAHARTRRTAVIVLVTVLASSFYFIFWGDDPASFADVLGIFGLLITSWVLGDNMRIRRAYVATVEERAERLERERDVEAQRAVLEERARIARELHDVVAHGMSVMVVQAGAARRTLDRDPAKATEAISHVEATGRSALDEMRRLVNVLRASGELRDGDGGPLRVPQPQPSDIDAMVDRCRDAGLDVTLGRSGEVRDLPQGLGLVVYRVVQEALTNTMRHAGPARASVCLDYQPEAVVVTVSDDGRGAAAARPDGEPGHGLAGMRERVTLYGGEMSAGPQAGGGFRVTASLPTAVDKPRAPTARAAEATRVTGGKIQGWVR